VPEALSLALSLAVAEAVASAERLTDAVADRDRDCVAVPDWLRPTLPDMLGVGGAEGVVLADAVRLGLPLCVPLPLRVPVGLRDCDRVRLPDAVTLLLGEREAEAEFDGDWERVALALGEREADTEAEGVTLVLGLLVGVRLPVCRAEQKQGIAGVHGGEGGAGVVESADARARVHTGRADAGEATA
jgi:hypothetical protein